MIYRHARVSLRGWSSNCNPEMVRRAARGVPELVSVPVSSARTHFSGVRLDPEGEAARGAELLPGGCKFPARRKSPFARARDL
jgi:hypothetical protein